MPLPKRDIYPGAPPVMQYADYASVSDLELEPLDILKDPVSYRFSLGVSHPIEDDKEPFTANTTYRFYRNNPDFPRNSSTILREMDTYKDANYPGEWTGKKLQQCWDAIKSTWHLRAEVAHQKLERQQLEGMIERGEVPNNTQLTFTDQMFYDVERGE
jgi:hypothetical protein